MTSGYRQTYDRWRADPQAFWAEAAREIAWITPPERIFDAQAGVYGRWFPDARCNACFNALDRHVEAGRGDQVALYYDSPRHRDQARHHLSRTARRDRDARRCAPRPRSRGRRPGPDLHADDSRGDRRHARLRAHRRRPFGGVWRLRRQGARDPHRRRRAEGHSHRELRRRAGPDRRIQAPARSRDHSRPAQAVDLGRLSAPADQGGHERGSRPRLDHARRRGQSGGQAGALRRPCRDRSALHSLYVGHDRNAERRGARHRRLSGRAQMVDVGDLRRQARRDLLDGLRHRLGRRPFLHRLRAAAAGLRQRPLRRQTDRDAGRRRLLAGDRGLQGRRVLHRADRLARRAQGGP